MVICSSPKRSGVFFRPQDESRPDRGDVAPLPTVIGGLRAIDEPQPLLGGWTLCVGVGETGEGAHWFNPRPVHLREPRTTIGRTLAGSQIDDGVDEEDRMDTHDESTPDERFETEGERIRSAGVPGERPDVDVETEGERIRAAGLSGDPVDPVAEAEAATTEAHKIRSDDLSDDESRLDVDTSTDAEKIRADGVE